MLNGTLNEASNGYISIQNSKSKQITPARFWPFYTPSHFVGTGVVISTGNFGEIKKIKFESAEVLKKENKPLTYADKIVAVKDQKGKFHDFVEGQYNLCHEVSCILTLHPYIINYIGGVEFGYAMTQRVGIVMEYMPTNLRKAIKHDSRLDSLEIKLQISKKIASGMNFLHSLNPSILHRDLRTPNILLNEFLEIKIADFGMSTLSIYEECKYIEIYTKLLPPECQTNLNKFSKAGDVYFYGWILIELFSGKKFDSYNIEQVFDELEKTMSSELKELIKACLFKNPSDRLTFNQIMWKLKSLLLLDYDLELIAQNNLMEQLKQCIENGQITPNICDPLGRNLLHHCCIFGNLKMLEYLVDYWGESYLFTKDIYDTTLVHLAARSGYLEILQYLKAKNVNLNEFEARFQLNCLDLSIAMNHKACVDFLIENATQEILDSALINSSTEGNLELVIKLASFGANLRAIIKENGACSLDRAAYNGHFHVVKYLLNQGVPVDQKRPSGCTPLYMASQNGHASIVKLLLEYGANPNVVTTISRSTSLFMASQYGHTEVIKLLLQYGADPNISINEGDYPLHIASYYGHLDAVVAILKYENMLRNKESIITKAIRYASRQGHSQIVAILEQHK